MPVVQRNDLDGGWVCLTPLAVLKLASPYIEAIIEYVMIF